MLQRQGVLWREGREGEVLERMYCMIMSAMLGVNIRTVREG